MVDTWENFKYYAKYGTVPTKYTKDYTQVPKNSFYKSVNHVNSVALPLKKCINSVIFNAVLALTYISLNLLNTAFAYLSYWPAKGFSKAIDNKDLKKNTESLVNYSDSLQNIITE